MVIMKWQKKEWMIISLGRFMNAATIHNTLSKERSPKEKKMLDCHCYVFKWTIFQHLFVLRTTEPQLSLIAIRSEVDSNITKLVIIALCFSKIHIFTQIISDLRLEKL